MIATPATVLSSLRWSKDGTTAPSGAGWATTFIVRVPTSSSKPSTIDTVHGDKTHDYREGDTEVAGCAVWFTNYSTWRAAPGIYLEDLFVRPEHRGKGLGKMLLRRLAKETLDIGGGRLEWSCLKWNEPSLKFYRSLGAVEKEAWTGLRVDGEGLEKLAGL